jgi:hypothetical protein
MTTKQNDKIDVRSINPPAVYSIQYPNSRTGMFSLRAPFKDFYTSQSLQQPPMRNVTPTVVQPKYLHMDQSNVFLLIEFLRTMLFYRSTTTIL